MRADQVLASVILRMDNGFGRRTFFQGRSISSPCLPSAHIRIVIAIAFFWLRCATDMGPTTTQLTV